MKPRTAVWITGVGAVTPLGDAFTDIADNLLEGRSGVRGVSGFDVSQHASQIAGQIGKIALVPLKPYGQTFSCCQDPTAALLQTHVIAPDVANKLMYRVRLRSWDFLQQS